MSSNVTLTCFKDQRETIPVASVFLRRSSLDRGPDDFCIKDDYVSLFKPKDLKQLKQYNQHGLQNKAGC